MRALASVRLRLFLIVWILFGAHFTTNIVREHYPAFALVDHGDFFLDEWAGFHADIYFHPVTQHWVVGNQVLGSVPAAIPLALLDPALDALQRWEQKNWADRARDAEYATDKPNRVAFFNKVRERGLILRFAATTVITSLLVMAPLGAALAVALHAFLERRGVSRERALALTGLFALGTPVFYRSAHLVHNMFLLAAMFASFLLLYRDPGDNRAHSPRRLALAGLLAGACLALDYAGGIALAALGLYLALPRWREAGFAAAARDAVPFVLGALPALAFLLATQASMYGDAFTPGQMHQQENAFTAKGVRGIDWPSPVVFWRNLFDHAWGLVPWAPFLALGFAPSRLLGGDASRWILPPRERRFAAGFALAFLVFCSMNQFSLLQWNTGFRYLLPLVPFLFLAAADFLERMPRKLFAALAIFSIAHVWVMTMSRFYQATPSYQGLPVPIACWQDILTRGPQIPALSVLRQMLPPDHFAQWPIWPAAVLLVVFASCFGIWRAGERAERAQSA